MKALPGEAVAHLGAHVAARLHAAWLVVDAAGCVTAAGGPLGRFGLGGVEVGGAAGPLAPLLASLASSASARVVPVVRAAGGVPAELHVLPREGGAVVVLVDARGGDAVAEAPSGVDRDEGTVLGALAEAGVAVLERGADGAFRARVAPPWLRRAVRVLGDGRVDVSSSAYLENFVVDAAAFWAGGGGGRLRSGAWLEVDAAGSEFALEASAVTHAGREVLLVEWLADAFEERVTLLQRAREAALELEWSARAAVEAAAVARSGAVVAAGGELEVGAAELLGIVSRELREPVSAVMGFAELLCGGAGASLSAAQREFAADIRAGGERLMRLSSVLLDLAGLEGGGLSLVRESFDAAAAVGAVVAEARSAVAVDVAVRVSASEARLVGDARRLRQAWAAVVRAALESAAPDAVVEVRVSSVGGVVLEVGEAGAGVECSLAEVARRVPAGGLGLLVARRVVAWHGGEVRVWVSGRAPSFRVWVPFAPGDPAGI